MNVLLLHAGIADRRMWEPQTSSSAWSSSRPGCPRRTGRRRQQRAVTDVRAIWPVWGAQDRLETLRVPTLLVVGERDRTELADLVEQLARDLPDARLETIAGAGHLPSLERPDELNRLLLDFLR